MAVKYNLVQSLCRASALLDYIGGEGRYKGITKIATHMGLHKSTCFGLLYTLQHLGYVTQDDSGRYTLGYKVFELGTAYLSDIDLRTIARPYLTKLGELSSETVHLVLRERLNAVYIDKIEGAHAMSMSSQVGFRADLHCTGVGKSILAFMTAEEQEAVMQKPMSAHTCYTITSPEKLREELARIRQRGYGLDEQEIEIGLCCLAVPIFGPQGKVIGGISIAGPEVRLSKTRMESFKPHLLKVAQDISRQMGCAASELSSFAAAPRA